MLANLTRSRVVRTSLNKAIYGCRPSFSAEFAKQYFGLKSEAVPAINAVTQEGPIKVVLPSSSLLVSLNGDVCVIEWQKRNFAQRKAVYLHNYKGMSLILEAEPICF